MQIKTVVILTEQVRKTDMRLLNIQNKLRNGTITENDYQELRQRIVGVGNELQSLANPLWNSAPIITFKNDLKTIINDRAVISKSIEKQIPVVVCVAHDIFSNDALKKNNLSLRLVIGRYKNTKFTWLFTTS